MLPSEKSRNRPRLGPPAKPTVTGPSGFARWLSLTLERTLEGGQVNADSSQQEGRAAAVTPASCQEGERRNVTVK